jgi:hypothetical protein
MKPKAIVTVVVLAFVAVSVGYLVVKEVRAAREAGVTTGGPSGAAPVATAERESGTGGTETAAATPTTAAAGGEKPNEELGPSAGDRKVVVAYYYNTSQR